MTKAAYMKKIALILAATSALAGSALFAQQTTSPAAVSNEKAQIGSFGFDEAGMDRSVDAGTDFYAFANGTWAKNTPIPADRSNYGAFTALDEMSQQRTREIVEAATKQPGNKVGDLYASFIDEAGADAKGMAPVKPMITKIKAMKTKADVAALAAEMSRAGIFYGPFAGYVGQDDKNPSNYIVSMFQSGLGLPDRDYYLKTDAEIVKTRTAYAAYLTKLLDLAGEPGAAPRAEAVMKFETELAKVQWTRIESRDSTKTYNKWARADFATKAPGFDWVTYMSGAGVAKQANFLVAQPSAFSAMAKLIGAAPMPVLRDYYLIHTLNGSAQFLSKPFVDAEFDFNTKTLNGAPQNRPRWKRGVDLVKTSMGEAVGEQYVAKYFPPEAKAEADKLVKNVIAAMDQRLAKLEWMAPQTKVAARAKLAAFTPKIGYPTRWRDYSALRIVRGDLFGNVIRANQFEWQRGLSKLGKPIDRSEWFMTPMEVNAYANPVMNEIVFPAAILQPPFFDPKADPAINYGGIGAVIGHEISHHFDDQGRKYDKNGALTDWWTDEDVKRFDALTGKLVAQYDAYEPLPGMKVQGKLTLGENIADLAGLTVAYDAYHKALGGAKAPMIDGFSGDQRFYLGWAQVWRRNYREANLRQRLLTDPHSPSIQRAWVVRNLDPWYGAFASNAGNGIALAPADRVRIW
jgi:putative endopeptidase